MKCEPLATTDSRDIRGMHNPLFFNNSEYNSRHGYRSLTGQFNRFARDKHFPLSNEVHTIVEHRPASLPGAD